MVRSGVVYCYPPLIGIRERTVTIQDSKATLGAMIVGVKNCLGLLATTPVRLGVLFLRIQASS